MKWQRCAAWVIAVACCGAAGEVRAQCETATITPADGTTGDQFGTACGIDGDRIIVGSPLHDGAIGAAYIYLRTPSGWIQEAKLTDQQLLPGDDFGRTVSISGDYAAVGAPKDDLGGTSTDKGRVYMYSRLGPTWVPENLSTPPFVIAGSEFGTSVSLSGDAVLVGAPFSDEVSGPPNFNGNSGSAYIFRRNAATGNWSQEAKLTAADAQELDQFGFNVVLHGDTAFVTAFGDKDPNISQNITIGSVYVFRKQGAAWMQVQKLVAPDAPTQAAVGARNFGRSLSTDGTVLLVGERSGQSAYVFRFNGSNWVAEAILKKPAGDSGPDLFGHSVAIQGDFAFVGAVTDDDNGLTNSGTVFAFQRLGGTWVRQPPVYGLMPVANGRLGASMAINDGFLLVGAIHPASAGRAHIFGTDAGTDCDLDGLADACQILYNPELDTNADGRLDQCPCMTDLDCNDLLDCTMDFCDPVSGECAHFEFTDKCQIDGLCWPAGTTNPAAFCQQCDPAQSLSAWSPRLDGLFCGSGTACRMNGYCASGECVRDPRPQGTPCGSSASTPCNAADSCDGAGNCAANIAIDFVHCTDNGVYCDGVEWCIAGQCVSNGVDPCEASPETPLCDEISGTCMGCLQNAECNDGIECTVDVCDEKGLCQNDPAPAGTFCGNSSDTICNGRDTCNGSGVCQSNIAPLGVLCGSLTVADCNQADTCNGAGTCLANLLPNGTKCTSNDLFCDGTEVCQGGVCVPSGVNPCLSQFTPQNCDEVNDACFTCVSPTQCADGNPCTNDICSPSGLCVHSPSPPGAACGLDPNCDTMRTCAGGQCVGPFTPNGTPCPDDGDVCTFDQCQAGVCAHLPAEFAQPCGPDDCNCNFIYDPCEVADGGAEDCNGNDIPDECERPVFMLSSANLSPIGDGFPQLFAATGLPEAMGDVTLALSAQADLFSVSEWIDVSINGQFVHRFFTVIGFDCANSPDVEAVVLPSGLFNGLMASGTVNILLVTSSGVNANLCTPPSYVRVRLEYLAPGARDCDGNGVLDECDLADDPANDCNGNEVMDACEIAGGTASDCNENGVLDECELADGRLNDVDPADGIPDECVTLYCNDFSLANPPNCDLDSAQPFDPANPDLLQGWTVFDLNLPPNCPLAGLSPIDFEVSVIPADVSAPTIGQVVPVAGLLRVAFDTPIPPGHWTCITLVQAGKTQCVAFLPGAVTGGLQVHFGDVLTMLVALWSPDPPTDHRYDVNRSGALTAEDLIVVQDLLNGAGAFEPWLGQSILSCPTGG